MKAEDAVVWWNPAFSHVTENPGAICVAPRFWDGDAAGFSNSADATAFGEFGQINTDSNTRSALLAMFVLFHTITVGDRVSVDVAHEAFLTIDEYRSTISPDIPGAA